MRIQTIGQILRRFVFGTRLSRALERHNRAANELDAAVKEMLKR